MARALYRARTTPAAILVLDEPSSALDATTEAHLWSTLRREADAGRAVLLVSHRRSADAIADRVVALAAGVPAPVEVPAPREASGPREAPEPREAPHPARPLSPSKGPGTPTGAAPSPAGCARERPGARHPALRPSVAAALHPALLAGFGTAASAVALLAASAWLIARAAEQPLVMYLSMAVVGVRAFALSRGVFRYLERLSGHDAALHQLAGVRADLVRDLVPLAPDGLARSSRGGLLSSVVDDVEELQNLPLRVVLPLVTAASTAVAAVIFTALISWSAALVLLACLVAAFAAAVALGWAAGARAERSLAPLRAAVADAVHDLLTNLDVLTAYGAVDAARERVRRADAALRRAVVRRGGAQGLTSGAVSTLAGVASLGALWVAAPAVTGGTLSGPGLAVVVLLPMAVFEVFGPVPLALASWRQVRAAAERIADAVPATVPDGLPRDEPAATGHAPVLGAGIELRGVGAHWPARSDGDGDAGRLVDVDLRVAPASACWSPVRAARARRPWRTCWCVSSTTTDRSASAGSRCETSRATTCATRSG